MELATIITIFQQQSLCHAMTLVNLSLKVSVLENGADIVSFKEIFVALEIGNRLLLETAR